MRIDALQVHSARRNTSRERNPCPLTLCYRLQVSDTSRRQAGTQMLHGQVYRPGRAVDAYAQHRQARLSPPSSNGQAHGTMITEAMPDTLSFPYAFPEAGRCTVWVQVKRKGLILTGAFRVEVVAPQ